MGSMSKTKTIRARQTPEYWAEFFGQDEDDVREVIAEQDFMLAIKREAMDPESGIHFGQFR
jgi:hypothetical protein